MPDFAQQLAERDRVLNELDLEGARKILKTSSPDEVVLLSSHTARLECLNISDAKRRESQKWLADRGYKSLKGEPVIYGAPLPT